MKEEKGKYIYVCVCIFFFSSWKHVDWKWSWLVWQHMSVENQFSASLSSDHSWVQPLFCLLPQRVQVVSVSQPVAPSETPPGEGEKMGKESSEQMHGEGEFPVFLCLSVQLSKEGGRAVFCSFLFFSILVFFMLPLSCPSWVRRPSAGGRQAGCCAGLILSNITWIILSFNGRPVHCWVTVSRVNTYSGN